MPWCLTKSGVCKSDGFLSYQAQLQFGPKINNGLVGAKYI
ncbi:hypothetical protein SS05631_a45880 (plasmid) [Sinorhizobium sp. CCBAU 05631]|nr:hypothetical protein SS05631_a45880 [Sinorhizobium sp. CCBAU 05631]